MPRKRKGETDGATPAPGSMSNVLPMRMTDERWQQKAESYVAQMGVIAGLVEDKKAENGRRQKEIDELLEEAEELRLELASWTEGKKQGDLIAQIDATPTPGQAEAGLGVIAKGLKARGVNVGGDDAFSFDGTEPPPAIDPAAAGPTAIEANRTEEAGASA